MRVSKNKISSPKIGIEIELEQNMEGYNSIFVELFGNSFMCVSNKEECDELLKWLYNAHLKVREWREKLNYDTSKQENWEP